MRPLLTIALLCVPVTHLLAQPTPATGSPVPQTESSVTGWIDLGYRWVSDTGGSFDTYRSFVNLGSGPKLLGAEFSLTDPAHRFFDRLRVRAYNLGGDPYETIHVDADKSKLYQFSGDYRDITYFDVLPSWADPLLSRGVLLNEQAYDTRRKMGNYQLDLLPGSRIAPYLNWEYNSSAGTGTAAFFTDANQFPVPDRQKDLTNVYRAGVRFELRRFHATLEQGRNHIQRRSATVPESGLGQLWQYLDTGAGPDYRSYQAAGRLRGSGYKYLYQGPIHGRADALARLIRRVPLLPTERRYQLSANRDREPVAGESAFALH